MSETTLYEKVKALADELEAPKLGGQTTWQDAQRDRDKWLAKQLRVLLDNDTTRRTTHPKHRHMTPTDYPCH